MIVIHDELCKGCKLCAKHCPLGAIEIVNKIAVVKEHCSNCGMCVRVCPCQAIAKDAQTHGGVTCYSCPIQCEIQLGFEGACRRYSNNKGKLVRNRPLVLENPHAGLPDTEIPDKPLITAVGSGTEYPCCKPAPHIVAAAVDGVEVVTVVTEAPLSYSGIKVKIDANTHIGEEGAKVLRDGMVVGMVDTEEYGAKMLSIGGANTLSGRFGFAAARTIVELANGERVKLQVEKGSKLELQVGYPPVIDGTVEKKMRIGCGSATVGMFAKAMAGAVDEAIVLDHHVIGLLSEHRAGEEVGLQYSGVIPNGRKSTRGRYFGEHGHGWGGTHIDEPVKAVQSVDMSIARPGMKILVTETTGQKSGLVEVQADGSVIEIPMTPQVQEIVDLIASNCEDAVVSAVYVGGTGGSARAGVTTYPIKLSQAIHAGQAKMTIGGAPVFILPGGGINFMVDVGKVVSKAFTWVPTPATVAPVEYTLTRKTYEEIGGHVASIQPLSELVKVVAERKNECL
ncbi:6-hydroxynicotinate reductase [Sporomusa ovata DSM 2662]|uniref:6-hydroxynicotinate reductase n=1 Tax=Sporomusa ovata TaxID=2378 RepID=A0A0U1KYL2_9FIRM|nr:4Fe-4S binding protein [Sporomusa ovata]EQB28938.1 4Fe-4S protein [Sporomusa ovata DSM 2662]CQR72365.1 6-hydroxynicotinate reductase [Sporomusa ovata]